MTSLSRQVKRGDQRKALDKRRARICDALVRFKITRERAEIAMIATGFADWQAKALLDFVQKFKREDYAKAVTMAMKSKSPVTRTQAKNRLAKLLVNSVKSVGGAA